MVLVLLAQLDLLPYSMVYATPALQDAKPVAQLVTPQPPLVIPVRILTPDRIQTAFSHAPAVHH